MMLHCVATSILSNVDPGTAGVNSVNVRNLGNGPDILSLGATMNYVDGSLRMVDSQLRLCGFS